MSEVQKFWCHEAQNIRCVRESDYDAAQADLLECGTRRKLAEQRLTAADQRNAELVELLRELDDNWNSHDGRERFSLAMRKVEAALKPTESGASE